MSDVRTVIFDLDGTLIDSAEGIVRATVEALEELGLEPMEGDVVKGLIGPPIGNSIARIRGYDDATRDMFFSRFRELYKTKHLMEAEIYPGIIDLLTALRESGCKTCIATNKREDYTADMLREFGIHDLFDSVRAQDDRNSRSKQSMITACMADTSSECADTFMVGDTEGDMNVAKAAGVRFIGVTYGFGFKIPEDVTYGECARSPEDILRIVRS